jgi:hypothetical protein
VLSGEERSPQLLENTELPKLECLWHGLCYIDEYQADDLPAASRDSGGLSDFAVLPRMRWKKTRRKEWRSMT